MTARKDRTRVDELLVLQGHAESRSKAKAMILAGDVRVGDRVIDRPAELMPPETELTIAQPPKYVSRGGFKLEHALENCATNVDGLIAADLGASTGGFTDCLLQHGATRVYAVDVGYGQLDYRLRQDPRVIVMERVNARHLKSLPESIDVVTIDVSFISLEHILGVAQSLLTENGTVIALIKPQFEAGKDGVDRRGVVREESVRRSVVEKVFAIARESGLAPCCLVRSPLVGPAGNEEFLAVFVNHEQVQDTSGLIDRVFNR
jgi:23S rRNA (cytidine1920-2'-O)/16S rRNA (cytidine1409-2'-O)-methyltransferase